MEIFIDRANLKSFVSSSNHAMFHDCCRMLKNKFDIRFTFQKTDIMSDDEIKQWITVMNDGANNDVKWNVQHPARPLKSNSHKNYDFSQLTAIYLLEGDNISQLRDNGLLLYGEVGQEIKVISSLIMIGTDYGFTKQIPIKSLSHWKDLNSFLSPCTDVILVDQYLFCFEELYDCNIVSLLTQICSYAKNRSKINIVILTCKSSYDKRTKRTFLPEWDKIKRSIKESVKKQTGEEPNLSFVLSSDLGEHDRTIFTNYKSIESGDTFNYFNNDWNIISDGRHIEIFSLADREFLANSKKFVEDMQAIVNKVARLNKDNIIGDKKSNFLNFS